MASLLRVDAAAIVRAKDGDHCIATWQRVFISVWRFRTPPGAIANMHRLLRAFMAERGDPVSMVMVIESTSSVPDAGGRAELAALSRDLVPKMNTAVVVAEGGGFRVATVRGVAIALTVLMPHKVPFKFVDTVGQASMVIAPYLPKTTGGATAFVGAVAAMREDHASAHARA